MSQPTLKAIVAMASNRVIGKDGDLPWHLPEDLKWFKKFTTGHSIIMGRKTMESIGKALPNRRSIVVSESLDEPPEGYELAANAEAALELVKNEETAFVIGGAQLFQTMLPQCEEVYLSLIFQPHDGDVLLPIFEDRFEMDQMLHRDEDFELRRYVRRG